MLFNAKTSTSKIGTVCFPGNDTSHPVSVNLSCCPLDNESTFFVNDVTTTDTVGNGKAIPSQEPSSYHPFSTIALWHPFAASPRDAWNDFVTCSSEESQRLTELPPATSCNRPESQLPPVVKPEGIPPSTSESNSSESNSNITFNTAVNAATPTTGITPPQLHILSLRSPTSVSHQNILRTRRQAAGSGNGSTRMGMTHCLVQFRKAYGVYYVPQRVRGTLGVGDLVQCEAGRGESTGTVISDLSANLHTLRMWYELRHATPTADKDDPLCPEDDPRPLYAVPPVSGLQCDANLQRLPRILRRGLNKDKKRVFFSRHRDSEALVSACRILQERGWDKVEVTEAVYQVDFLTLTLHCQGSPHRTPWNHADFTAVGSYLTVPLRTGVVEFRFSYDHPEELHLTRYLLGDAVEAFQQKILARGRLTSNLSQGKPQYPQTLLQHGMSNSSMQSLCESFTVSNRVPTDSFSICSTTSSAHPSYAQTPNHGATVFTAPYQYQQCESLAVSHSPSPRHDNANTTSGGSPCVPVVYIIPQTQQVAPFFPIAAPPPTAPTATVRAGPQPQGVYLWGVPYSVYSQGRVEGM